MAEILSTLSIVLFVLAGICFVLAIFLWFSLKIPSVIGDLTGSTARKSIERMRSANERTGNKIYRESKTNVERGRLTEAHPSLADKPEDNKKDNKKNKKIKKNKDVKEQKVETGLLMDNKAQKYESDATSLLIDEEATAPLDNPAPKFAKRSGGKTLIMIEEIIMIHTDEVI